MTAWMLLTRSLLARKRTLALLLRPRLWANSRSGWSGSWAGPSCIVSTATTMGGLLRELTSRAKGRGGWGSGCDSSADAPSLVASSQ